MFDNERRIRFTNHFVKIDYFIVRHTWKILTVHSAERKTYFTLVVSSEFNLYKY